MKKGQTEDENRLMSMHHGCCNVRCFNRNKSHELAQPSTNSDGAHTSHLGRHPISASCSISRSLAYPQTVPQMMTSSVMMLLLFLVVE